MYTVIYTVLTYAVHTFPSFLFVYTEDVSAHVSSSCKHRDFFNIIALDANLFFIVCRRGSILSTTIFVYAATAPINGFMGGSLYARQGGLFAISFKKDLHVLIMS